MAEFTEAEMMKDLARADAAGDTQLAQHIAGRIKDLRARVQSAQDSTRDVASGPAVQKIGEGLIPGYNRVVAGIAAATDPLLGINTGPTFGERYQNRLRASQAQSDKTQTEHPWLSAAGQTIGGVPLAIMTGGASRAAPAVEGVTRGAQALTGLRVGAGLGAAYGAGNAPADAGVGTIASHTAGGAILGGGMGAGMGALLPSHLPNPDVLRAASGKSPAAATAEAASAAASRQSAAADATGGNAAAQNTTSIRIVPPKSKTVLARALQEPDMSPEAKLLADRGVKLTTGLRDPTSPAAQTEIASQSLPFTGPVIRQQRASALTQAMDLGFNEALPPGAPKIPSQGSPQQKLDALARHWNTAYDGVKKSLGTVQPAVLEGEAGTPLVGAQGAPGAIEQAVRNPEILADDANRSAVERFVLAKLTKLNGRTDGAGRVSAADLLSVRSDIREQARKALSARNQERADLLDAAEDQITRAIESQADDTALARLRELDGRYFNFKVMQKAVTRAKDSPAGITPASFSEAVYQTMADKNAYARGGGGGMRDLSGAIRSVFDESSAPPNGSRLATLDSLPWMEGAISRWGTGPAIVIRNRQLARATGGNAMTTAEQLAAAMAASRGQSPAPPRRPDLPMLPGLQSPSAAIVEAMRRTGVRIVPTYADDEDRRR